MGSDIADRFRRGDYFKTTRNDKPAYGYVYEYDKTILVSGDATRGFRVERSEVPSDATHIFAGEIVALPREINLVFKTAVLVSGN